MNKSLFIKEKVRKVISIPCDGRKNNINLKIYNYTEESKKAVFEMYEKKSRLGLEDFSLSTDELRYMFVLFTDLDMSLDELIQITDNPNFYFDQIINELEIILSEIVVLYIQEKQKEIARLKIDEAILDMNNTIAEQLKNVESSDK